MTDQALASSWWIFILRGILGIIFGVLALIAPVATFLAIVWLFGAYALVDGVVSIFHGLRDRASSRWFWELLGGVISVIAGLIAFFQPVVAGLALVYVIGAWAIVGGIVQIIAAIQLRKTINNEFWLALGGVMMVLFGVIAFLFPGITGLSLVWVIGVWAILFGVIFIILGFKVRGMGSQGTPAAAAA
ncbi:MAG: HdeD family acid-resistance protein [Dehalococcoidia bacterium]